MKLKEQHLHKKLVHFNRTKHKINPWLTGGILKSYSLQLACLKTNYKKNFIANSQNYPAIVSNFKAYKNIIR